MRPAVTVDKRDARARADRALRANNPGEALGYLWQLVDRSHVIDEELTQYLRSMGQAYHMLGRSRAAATILLFLGRVKEAADLSRDVPLDLARCAQHHGSHETAAQYFEQAGWLGHAAIQLEDAGNLRAARVLWEQLAEDARLRDQPYTQGLVRFNLGRACKALDDRGAARRHTIQAMHLLEAAADGFETQGMRERAFDCYQIIMTIGKGGSFENLAEGYLNCIRILREDNLKYYVLQYYEDFQALALERGELHAAATLFREAAEYARRQGMPYARHYQHRGAEVHVEAARRTLADGGTPELAENSYAAAIDAFNELGLYSRVREIYGLLAQLPLADKRKARYARLQQRLAEMEDDRTPMSAFPDYLRMDTAYPEIWRLDVIEWEQAGDPAETMAEVIQDQKWPDFTRRRALLCRLAQLETGEPTPSVATLERLTGYLGRVEIYAALAPLETMYESESAAVRAGVLKAVRQLFFKRSFALVILGLADPDANVRREALAAVGALHFGHAFDPLSRIYREASDPEVRRASLASIGKIPSVQAAELLIDVLRHGDRVERDLARELLVRADHTEVTPLLQRAAAAESGAARAEFDKVLRMRGAV
ncbi:MAG: HEAT repeat domain-containing protein [Sandaracinaceae bacterium]|nr:HEAT repeat domain-containing protein [Sandaracinaceae bacterium]